MLEIKHCNFQGPQPGIRLLPGPGPGSGPGPDIQTYKNKKKSCHLRTQTHSTPRKIYFSDTQDLYLLDCCFCVSVLSVHPPQQKVSALSVKEAIAWTWLSLYVTAFLV